MTLAPTSPRFERTPVGTRYTPVTAAKPAVHDAAVAEERRWLTMLLVPFLAGAVFFGAAVGTGKLWLMGGSIVVGVMFLIFAFLYLSITSNSN